MAYQPAVNTTLSPGMAQLATVYYKKVGLGVLYQKLRFMMATEPDDIPQRSGKTVQWFRPLLLSSNTTPASEGVVGAGVPLSTQTVTGTVSEYSDFTSVSTLLLETAINNMIEMASKMMSYRAALTVDTIIRTAVENSGVTIQTSIGSYLVLNDFRKQAKLLEGKNVDGKLGMDYLAIINPYNAYDVISDNTAGGFLDAVKYVSSEMPLMGELGRAGSCRIVSTTAVGTDGVAAPNTKYYSYYFGSGGLGGVSLMGSGPSDVQDPDKQTFKLNVIAGGPNPSDPAGEIGTYVSYRFVYTAVTLDTTNYRFAIVKADSSII